MKKKYAYIGIDPGASGGLAIVWENGSRATKMPETEKDVWDWLKAIAHNDVLAVIEKVSAMPGQGVTSMFTFGKGYGGLRMALIGCGIPFEEIPPKTWQKAMGLGGRKEAGGKKEFKSAMRAKAQQYFPKEKVTLATADALLLALYCKRKNEGAL